MKCERGMHQKEKGRYHVNETFAINIMIVVLLGLQQIGEGCSDTIKLLTFVNLLIGKSMKADKFKIIEDSIGCMIRNKLKKYSKYVGRGSQTHVRVRKEGKCFRKMKEQTVRSC